MFPHNYLNFKTPNDSYQVSILVEGRPVVACNDGNVYPACRISHENKPRKKELSIWIFISASVSSRDERESSPTWVLYLVEGDEKTKKEWKKKLREVTSTPKQITCPEPVDGWEMRYQEEVEGELDATTVCTSQVSIKSLELDNTEPADYQASRSYETDNEDATWEAKQDRYCAKRAKWIKDPWITDPNKLRLNTCYDGRNFDNREMHAEAKWYQTASGTIVDPDSLPKKYCRPLGWDPLPGKPYHLPNLELEPEVDVFSSDSSRRDAQQLVFGLGVEEYCQESMLHTWASDSEPDLASSRTQISSAFGSPGDSMMRRGPQFYPSSFSANTSNVGLHSSASGGRSWADIASGRRAEN